MAFGFGVGDVVMLTKFIVKVIGDIRDAPAEVQKLGERVEVIRRHLQSINSLPSNAATGKTNHIAKQVQRISEILSQLKDIVIEYGKRDGWRDLISRAKYGILEKGPVADIVKEVESRTDVLIESLIFQTWETSNGTASKVDEMQQMLQQIQQMLQQSRGTRNDTGAKFDEMLGLLQQSRGTSNDTGLKFDQMLGLLQQNRETSNDTGLKLDQILRLLQRNSESGRNEDVASLSRDAKPKRLDAQRGKNSGIEPVQNERLRSVNENQMSIKTTRPAQQARKVIIPGIVAPPKKTDITVNKTKLHAEGQGAVTQHKNEPSKRTDVTVNKTSFPADSGVKNSAHFTCTAKIDWMSSFSANSPLNAPKGWILVVDKFNTAPSIIAQMYFELFRMWTVNSNNRWLFYRVESAGSFVETDFAQQARRSGAFSGQDLIKSGTLPTEHVLGDISDGSHFYPLSEEKSAILRRIGEHKTRGLQPWHFRNFEWIICLDSTTYKALTELSEYCKAQHGHESSGAKIMQIGDNKSTVLGTRQTGAGEIKQYINNIRWAVGGFLRMIYKWQKPNSSLVDGVFRTRELVLLRTKMQLLGPQGERESLLREVASRTKCSIRVTDMNYDNMLIFITGRNQSSLVLANIALAGLFS